MFNNIPNEELIKFFEVFAKWCFEMARWAFITAIVFLAIGLMALGVISLIRSTKVKRNVRYK